MTVHTPTVYTDVASLLIDLEAELRRGGYWQAEPLDAAALASVEPFGVDTMTLAQWLQFIFIPRMHLLAAAQQPLPGRCEVVPIAEEFFGKGPAEQKILALIDALDRAINRG